MSHSGAPHILVIDDSEVNRYILNAMLRRAGFSVSDGATGADALRLVEAHDPDLVVLDVHLPDISGLEVCQRLKSSPATAGIPVLHLSATYVRSEDKVAGLDSGADAYLTQPVDSRELLATVNSLLRARRAEDALRRIQWLLHRSVRPEAPAADRPQPYGDLTELNRDRTLLDAVGADVLREVASEYLDLLDSRSAIYEASGDYALCTHSSGWCRFIDEASRRLCGMVDNREALACGRWHCHECSWHEASERSILEGRPVDIECRGGIRLYAVPITARGKVVGSINVGYGDPPRDPQKLKELAERYGVATAELKRLAEAYESRPPFIIDVAKKRVHTAARLIGEIVERKHAERAAEEASRAKDHFLAVLSHELRTPLTPVLTAASLLEREPGLPDRHRELVEMILRNAELETRLIDDLLDVTRIARGKIELARAPVDLCAVVRRAAEVCGQDIRAGGLELDLAIPATPLSVMGDAARLQQVFWNLIKNAVKFTPPGGRIAVRAERDGDRAVARVVDNGRGIEPHRLSAIFNAFEQGDRGVTRTFGGLGLGLAICRSLVNLHGGTIAAESEGVGRGATFVVELPALATDAEPRPTLAGTALRGPATDGPLHVLLVEDHADTARLLGLLLRGDGHSVQHAGTIESALDRSAAEEFDLLISDLGLPDGSGNDLIRRLLERGGKPRLGAIAVSGYGMLEDVQRSREAGFDRHITKPVDFHMLQAAIQYLRLESAGTAQ